MSAAPDARAIVLDDADAWEHAAKYADPQDAGPRYRAFAAALRAYVAEHDTLQRLSAVVDVGPVPGESPEAFLARCRSVIDGAALAALAAAGAQP